MSDTVTSAAIATGDVAAVQATERALGALFSRGAMRAAADTDVARALEDVVGTPTIGAVAAVELARIGSGWTVEIGVRNSLARYQAFAAALVSGGWFLEGRALMAATTLPAFRSEDPVGSLEALVAVAHPDLSPADRRCVCRALVGSLAHTLGPDGIPPETVEIAEAGLLGGPKVLERRVTTVSSTVLSVGDAPVYTMHWKTEVFERTQSGKDSPKAHTERDTKNHRLVFNLQRWREGDRLALLDYYRYVDDWLRDFNSAGGRPRSMACFATLMGG